MDIKEIDVSDEINDTNINKKTYTKSSKILFFILFICLIIEFINIIFFILLYFDVRIFRNEYKKYCFENFNGLVQINIIHLIINIIFYIQSFFNIKEQDHIVIYNLIISLKFYIVLFYLTQLLLVFNYDNKFICYYIRPINIIERIIGIKTNVI